MIVDDFESDLRFAGRPIPSLAALDATGLVVQLSSFSKSLFPGVRVGAIASTYARSCERFVQALLFLESAAEPSAPAREEAPRGKLVPAQ